MCTNLHILPHFLENGVRSSAGSPSDNSMWRSVRSIAVVRRFNNSSILPEACWRCFCALTKIPPNLPNSVLTLARVLLIWSALFWILRVLNPTDRELRRADRVLGPATIICSSRLKSSKKTGFRTISWVETFCRNKQNSKIGRPRRCYVLTLDILGKSFDAC